MASEEEPGKFPQPEKTVQNRSEAQVLLDIPERFRDGDDADEDCTAIAGGNAYMSQSVFGMIAAAGPQVNFNSRYNHHSSDDTDDQYSPSTNEARVDMKRSFQKSHHVKKHRKKFSHHSILPSVSGLRFRSKSKISPKEPDKQLFLESADVNVRSAEKPREHDIDMSHIPEITDKKLSRSSLDLPRIKMDEDEDHLSTGLSKKLMEIFQLKTAEDVLEEYPCWLMNSVLLQGYMYITNKHICFFAYLPKKSNEVVRSGYLFKSGRRNPKFHRYWFRLKGDVLSYYTDPSDLYFLRGNIDLRYGISATLSSKENPRDAVHFSVVTHQREYNFKADSATSAREWVKAIQKIIFRSRNEGDSVKISLPIDNVIDIEESQIIDFADTCRIRIVDNGDTYAVDEYFFSFFRFGQEALSLLRKVVEDTTARQIKEQLSDFACNDKLSPDEILTPKKQEAGGLSRGKKLEFSAAFQNSIKPFLEENVRATLSPIGATTPRASSENSRGSIDFGRKSYELKSFGHPSLDPNKAETYGSSETKSSHNLNSSSEFDNREKLTNEKQPLSGSYIHSPDEPSLLDASPSASDCTHATGSLILRGSEVFLSPTIQHTTRTTVDHDIQVNLSFHENIDSSYTRRSSEVIPDSCNDRTEAPSSASAPTLHNIVKVGAYPLQRAAGFAGYINRHSKRMSNLLATESIGYVEKVSGMWKGGKKHYDETHCIGSEEIDESGENEDVIGSAERFREHFSLPKTERLQATYFGFLNRVLPLYGKIYISDRSFCFRSLLPGTNTKLILPLKDIENVDKEKGFRFGYSGLVVVIKAHEELFFEFSLSDTRDDCAVTLLQNLEALRSLHETGLLSLEEKQSAQTAVAENLALLNARSKGCDVESSQFMKGIKTESSAPIFFDDPRASILSFKPAESLRITCLTIGSRGDVQPYIALCKGLIAEGHRPRIATHLEFKFWVESHGIEFKPVSGDPAELMRICIENGMFTYSFLREASANFRGWIDELLKSAWIACQDSDLLIESPSAMGGIHIAEALEIPYFRAFTMPWTRTRAYPHAFAVPERKMGGAYNYITYIMFDNIFWKAIAGQVNWWRKKELGLDGTNLEKMQPNKVPFLYNFSPAVVVPPLDYSDWIRVTGYWFLDEGTNWNPPQELTEFIANARKDEKKLVYVGFGSIVVQDSAALMTTIIKSVEKSDIRCILSRGWSDRMDKKDTKKVEPPLPPSILQIRSAPHDWLFNQIDAAAHHGGAGTTGASLRAGIPTVIKPFFGDQYFFGSRVEDLGVGISLKKLNVSLFSRALWQACNDQRMILKAKLLGETIRDEDGVSTAIQTIYRDLEYAKSLIKRRDGKPIDDAFEDSEESWTFINQENEPELVRRIHGWKSNTEGETIPQEEERDDNSDTISIHKFLGERTSGVMEQVSS